VTRDQGFDTLYNLIFRGFLVGECEMGGSNFVFKTITDKEFNLIKSCAGNPDTVGFLERFNMYFLAHSVFAVNGENILDKRAQALTDLASFFSNIPGYSFKYLMSELDKLRIECYESLKFLEGFCYTTESRRMWKANKGLAPCTEIMTGIPGTSLLGLNAHQESWMQVNRSLDDGEAYDRELSLTLIVASASNPKGAKHIRSQHDSHVKNMEEHRKKLAEVGYIDTKNWASDQWAAPVDTAEELVAELDRQMKGMKDRHDKFIEKHLKDVKDTADKKAKEIEDRIKASRMIDDNPALTSIQRALTSEETSEMLSGRSRKMTTVPVFSEEYAHKKDMNRIFQKMGSKVLTARK
jgi:hypothetical protein